MNNNITSIGRGGKAVGIKSKTLREFIEGHKTIHNISEVAEYNPEIVRSKEKQYLMLQTNVGGNGHFPAFWENKGDYFEYVGTDLSKLND